jgi:hypothetical protein
MDDNFADHPKVDALSHGAFRLHVAGLCYCAKHLTDGVVPAERIARLIRGYRPAMLAELNRAKLWLAHPDGYEIHDFLDWNRSRAWWTDKRRTDAARVARWRAERRAEREGES